MRKLVNVACGDQYTDAATLSNVIDSSGGYFNITGADCYVEVQYGISGQTNFTDEVHVPVGGGILVKGTTGIRFRNFVAGSVATVSAALSEKSEPPIQIAATGQSAVTPTTTAMELIFDFTVTIAQNVLDSQTLLPGALPTTFKHIKTFIECRSSIASANDNLFFRLNADAGNNYDWQRNYGNSGAMVSLDNSPDTNIFCGFISGNTTPAGEVSFHEITLLDYQGVTLGKTVFSNFYCPINTVAPNGFAGSVGGKWRTSGTPVTRLQYLCGGNNFQPGTRISCYGF